MVCMQGMRGSRVEEILLEMGRGGLECGTVAGWTWGEYLAFLKVDLSNKSFVSFKGY